MGGQDKRVFPRYQIESLRVHLQGKTFGVEDISAEGILINGQAEALVPGDPCPFDLSINILDKPRRIGIKAVVIRNDPGKLALRYSKPGATWHKLLQAVNRREQ